MFVNSVVSPNCGYINSNFYQIVDTPAYTFTMMRKEGETPLCHYWFVWRDHGGLMYSTCPARCDLNKMT